MNKYTNNEPMLGSVSRQTNFKKSVKPQSECTEDKALVEKHDFWDHIEEHK